jgi:hypothetical protein
LQEVWESWPYWIPTWNNLSSTVLDYFLLDKACY